MTDEVFTLKCPDTVRLQMTEDGVPLQLSDVAFFVTATARRRNDFRLGPFYTNQVGCVVITAQQLRWHAASVIDADLMGHGNLEDCAPDVSIGHMTGEETSRLATFRRTHWHLLLAGEAMEYQSIDDFINRLVRSKNGMLHPPSTNLMVRWDGSNRNPAYQYPVLQVDRTAGEQ